MRNIRISWKSGKRKAFVLLFFIYGTWITGYCQSIDSTKSIVFKYAPTSLLNPVYPAIHIGAEFELKDRLRFQPEFGLLLKHHLLNKNEETFGWRSFDSENKGFFIKAELRRHLKHYPAIYGAAQIQLIKNNYTRTDKFETDTSTRAGNRNGSCSKCVIETYKINKTAVGLNLKLGYQKEVSKKILFDLYGGLGINYIRNRHSKNSELHNNPAEVGWTYLPHYSGNYIYPFPTIAVGVKVGYRVGK